MMRLGTVIKLCWRTASGYASIGKLMTLSAIPEAAGREKT
jgi:hypothetical protein